MTICCAWLNSLWIWVEVFINIFEAVRVMLAEGWPKTVLKKRTSSWWPAASLWCVIDCVNIVLICKFTFSRQLNQSTKLIIFFFFLKIGSFETKNQLQKFVIILFCFWFHDNLIPTLFLKPWLVFSDWANMTSFSEFISKGTHSPHHAHTKNSSVIPTNFHSKKTERRTYVSAGTSKKHNISSSWTIQLSQTHKQTIILLFVLFFCLFGLTNVESNGKCCFVFLFFLGFESNMTNKRLMSMWWSLSLLFVLVMETIDILLCDSKNTKWKRRKMKLESNTTQHIFFSFHPKKKKTHLSPFQTLFLTLFQTLKTTHKSFFPSFFVFVVRFALVVIFPVCLSHGNAKKNGHNKNTEFQNKSKFTCSFSYFSCCCRSCSSCCEFAFCSSCFFCSCCPCFHFWFCCFFFVLLSNTWKRNRIGFVLLFWKETNKQTSNSSMTLEHLFCFAKSSGVSPSCLLCFILSCCVWLVLTKKRNFDHFFSIFDWCLLQIQKSHQNSS